MGGNSDWRRVAAAQVSGCADAYAQHRRLTADEALAEIREIMAGVRSDQHRFVLDEAAARYTRPDGEPEWYFAASFDLLVQAGADPDRARAIWDARPRTKGLGGLGEGGGGKR